MSTTKSIVLVIARQHDLWTNTKTLCFAKNVRIDGTQSQMRQAIAVA